MKKVFHKDKENIKDNKSIEIEGKEQSIQYATLNRRVIAIAIDMVIFTLISTPIIQLFFIIKIGNTLALQEVISNFFEKNSNSSISLNDFINYLSAHKVLWLYLSSQIINFIILIIFFVSFWLYKGATPGKLLTKCVIVDEKTLNKISLKQCVLRILGYIISVLPLGLGFFIIGLNKKKRGIHDMIAKTLVIVKPKKQ